MFWNLVNPGYGPIALNEGVGWTPAAIVTAAWYDPSDMSTLFQDAGGTVPVTADNDPVGRINDKSGNGRHATQVTDAARPIFRTSGGRSWIEGNGVGLFLRATFALSQPWERVSAIRQVTWTSGDAVFGATSNVAGLLQQSGVSPDLRIFSGVALAATGEVLGQNQIVTERYNGASSRIAIDNGAYATGDAGTNVCDGITFFAREAAVGAYGDVRCYGVVMRGGTLSDADITRLRQYLAAKAGISL